MKTFALPNDFERVMFQSYEAALDEAQKRPATDKLFVFPVMIKEPTLKDSSPSWGNDDSSLESLHVLRFKSTIKVWFPIIATEVKYIAEAAAAGTWMVKAIIFGNPAQHREFRKRPSRPSGPDDDSTSIVSFKDLIVVALD
jgi:hypothetical protein